MPWLPPEAGPLLDDGRLRETLNDGPPGLRRLDYRPLAELGCRRRLSRTALRWTDGCGIYGPRQISSRWRDWRFVGTSSGSPGSGDFNGSGQGAIWS